jgi:hypothetical protein
MADMKQLGLRLPDDLHAWLAELAGREHRSLNAQVIVILEQRRAAEREHDTGRSGDPS